MLNVLPLTIGVFSIIFLFDAVVALHASYSYGMCEVSVDPLVCAVHFDFVLLIVVCLRIAVLCVIHSVCYCLVLL